MKWFDRSFGGDLSASLLPGIFERLRGTPYRLQERLSALTVEQLVTRPADGSWSIQENAGHLCDLEPLWSGRIEDLVAQRPVLRAADLSNQATGHANHNRRHVADLVRAFHEARIALLGLAISAATAGLAHQALHPRLGIRMRLVDHLAFVAEHDDHHLARITALRDRWIRMSELTGESVE